MHYEDFSHEARRAMAVANQVATRYEHQFIAPEHILIGVLAQQGVSEICMTLGIAPDAVARTVEDSLAKMMSPPPRVPVAKKIIDLAIEEARTLRHRGTGSHHLLLGILRQTDTLASQALHDAGLAADRLRDELVRRFPPEVEETERPLRVRIQQHQSHPEVQALQQQMDAFQRQQENALANQDLRAAAELRDKKVEVRMQLKALRERLDKQ